MKIIQNGIVYDTDSQSAYRVARWSNGYNAGDFHRCEEELFRTKKGRWFLYGNGGALSQYAERCGNGSCSGEAIIPYTPEQARDWLEEHDCVETYREYFGDDLEEA